MPKTFATIEFAPIGGGVTRSGLGFYPILMLYILVLIVF